MAFTANARQTYSTPFVRLPTADVGSVAEATSTPLDHVTPLSLEHSYWNPDTVAGSSGATVIRTAPFDAATAGWPGTGGRPIGVAVVSAGVHGPTDVGPTTATSHW